ncbi:Hypothetical predicted protein [Pelobates cultripes]|uniref:Uncharacterized protein n=1 Tax=Pelobates cultripes TaxID=61616 RepID=A0AAD1WTY1_PELCU|nr:Hypothetical predicted protein [Pelobates cultripes]
MPPFNAVTSVHAPYNVVTSIHAPYNVVTTIHAVCGPGSPLRHHFTSMPPEYAETTIHAPFNAVCGLGSPPEASLHLPHTGAWHAAADGSLDGRHLPPRSRRPACAPLPSDLTAGGKVTSGRCVTNARTAPMRSHSQYSTRHSGECRGAQCASSPR